MPSITVNYSGADHSLHTITHKSVYAAHRILGVRPTPAGGNTTQSHQCLARSNTIAEGVRLNMLARNEALMGYRHIWLPSVGAKSPTMEDTYRNIKVPNAAFQKRLGGFTHWGRAASPMKTKSTFCIEGGKESHNQWTTT